MDEYMLSTSDNPFNPYTHWDEWYAFDTAAGYHTSAYLARVVVSSMELSEYDQSLAIKEGVDEILEYNITGNYIKVPDPLTPTKTTTTQAEVEDEDSVNPTP